MRILLTDRKGLAQHEFEVDEKKIGNVGVIRYKDEYWRFECKIKGENALQFEQTEMLEITTAIG